ncbi:unnamed protein product [Echinostoma caproni]|uniref:NAM-associated domain-containing protein n=1 Tax=Echinostoma caproni TaxID=27848 RepID=A0A183AIJ9_9TREM|nr:unnamed protein product [Echinostoma caproni]
MINTIRVKDVVGEVGHVHDLSPFSGTGTKIEVVQFFGKTSRPQMVWKREYSGLIRVSELALNNSGGIASSPGAFLFFKEMTALMFSVVLNGSQLMSSPEPEIKIQMKPLLLASEHSTTRQNEIDYIEGSSFTQKSFSSTRKQHKPFAPDSDAAVSNNSTPLGSQYASLLAEKAHDAAIFGPHITPPPSTVFGSDPTEAKECIVSSVVTFTKPDETAWASWLVRLRDLKEARAKQLSLDVLNKRSPNTMGSVS